MGSSFPAGFTTIHFPFSALFNALDILTHVFLQLFFLWDNRTHLQLRASILYTTNNQQGSYALRISSAIRLVVLYKTNPTEFLRRRLVGAHNYNRFSIRVYFLLEALVFGVGGSMCSCGGLCVLGCSGLSLVHVGRFRNTTIPTHLLSLTMVEPSGFFFWAGYGLWVRLRGVGDRRYFRMEMRI